VTFSLQDIKELMVKIQSTNVNIVKFATTITNITTISRMFHLLAHSQVSVLLCVFTPHVIITNRRVKAHYEGAILGTFTTCMWSIFLQNMLHFILGFTFSVWAWYFDFHKGNDISYYLKKKIKIKSLNSNNNEYIYDIYSVIKPFCFWTTLNLGLN
jgi:hypothetical protein